MKTHAQIVIVGGGVIGVSIAYHLAKFGQKDVVLCERSELTAGSTWHAAGLLPLFNMSYSVGQLHKYSVDLYKTLEAETGQSVSFHQTGNLRLAANQERMDEYHAYCGTANTIGVPFEIITPAQVKELWPLCNTEDLVGALFHPEDGHAAPVDVTMALARGARSAGAEIYLETEVTGIARTQSGEWRVQTNKGDIVCEKLVSATGNYARQTAAMIGLDIPVIPVEHQYIVTDTVPELEERKAKGLPELAVLRDSDAHFYMREERNGYILGPYERKAKACFVDGVPKGFGKELFEGDLERLEPYVEAAIHRVPGFAHAGIKDIVNGPIAYTPDGNPLLGEAFGVRNFYLAEGFGFGITAAGGAGKMLAEQIIHGESETDSLAVDPRRFGAYANHDYARIKNVEAYEHVFIVHYPTEERPLARPSKTSPCHERLGSRGAVWGQRYGWERPLFFDAASKSPNDHWSFRRARWFGNVAEECLACRNAAGLIDLTGFAKFEVSGHKASEWLETMIANSVPKRDGRIHLGHALFPKGGVRSELTITRMNSEFYYLVSSGGAERYDHDLLLKNLPEDGSVHLRNVTLERGVFVLIGPHSRDILAKLTKTPLDNESFPWLSGQTISIGLSPDIRALRVNFVGELGWELHHPIAHQNALFDALAEAGEEYGLKMVGMRAMDSMRIEKSYRMWGLELTSDYSPLAAGLSRFVKLNKPGYQGREALLREQGAGGSAMRFVTLEIEVSDADCFGNEPIYLGEKMIGRACSGGYGHRIQKSLALGYVEAGHDEPGTECEVIILGTRHRACILAESPYDPENKKLRDQRDQ